ncbi:thiolase family protein [Amycolatopsis thermophila]|uniref:Acetyl-CoA acetyltransferase n=1 Tax=Amycolatopsis thermophila TaxID=206084 RepID=A0ABU0F5D2_9PSEU|nr:thiolase family protein [Amycolatopsis thermophila]MDQ0382766.1 acetyl-CoA acetyltransferase [Amycolatopsis thermophila]
MTVRTAIAGLGMSEIGKVYGYTASEFASIAVRDAVADAGLELGDLDGLIVSSGLGSGVDLGLQGMLGLTDLNLLTSMQGYGSTAAQMVQYASMAIRSGMANTIAVVWADDPLKENVGAGAAYRSAASLPTGWRGMMAAGGLSSANTYYALAARRHMQKYGTTNDHLGAIAVAQRQWATMNPLAQMRKPITLADYHASRWISEPFHLLDCCLVSNGGIALVITSLDRARTLKQPPVEVLGWAQTHPGRTGVRNEDFGLVSGAARSGPAALRMADTKLDEIDVVEVYDCYTFTALITLEDYGFCEKGEGGPFLAEPGTLGPNGKLKVNTGGGELSSYYLWGMTPLSEAVIQTRGQAGERQVARHDRVLVSGNGGTLDHHATLVLGTV